MRLSVSLWSWKPTEPFCSFRVWNKTFASQCLVWLEFSWLDSWYKWRPYITILCYKFRGTVCRLSASWCKFLPEEVPRLWQGSSVNVSHINEFHSALRRNFSVHDSLLLYYIIFQRLETWRSSVSRITVWTLGGVRWGGGGFKINQQQRWFIM